MALTDTPDLTAPATGDWLAPVAGGGVTATVSVPGSKSLTNRYLILAALAESQSLVRGWLRSRDTELMVDALKALGADIDNVNGNLHITPIDFSAHREGPPVTADWGEP